MENWEIFVFGANAKGEYIGGAALTAKEKFGAIEGQIGLNGQSYGFITLNEKMERLSDDEIKKETDKLIKSANENTSRIFLLTKVGCGIAGYDEEKVKTFFKRQDIPANIIVPKSWEYLY
mgnify:FL=1